MAARRSKNDRRSAEGRTDRAENVSTGPKRWPWVVALVAILAAWGGVELARARTRGVTAPTAASPSGQASTAPPRPVRTWRTFEGQPGPWGRLHYTRISIEPPDAFLPDDRSYGDAQWFFLDQSKDQVDEILRSAGLTPEQVDLARAHWTVGSDGVLIDPPAELVVSLAAPVRARLYAQLAQERANIFQHLPTTVRPEFLEERLETAGLTPATVALFKSLLYQRGSWTLFSDLQTLLKRVAEPSERRRAVAMSLRNTTLMVQLELDERSDIAAIAHYWDFPGRAKDLEPLLRSLARVPGGYRLDLGHLLPPMPRRRIYTYPHPDEDRPGAGRDCYWTSVNFFAPVSDDTFLLPQKAVAELHARYHLVEPPYNFGDVLLMSSARAGHPVHAAVYLADDLTFTKNGGSSRQPWMVMTRDDLVSYYHTLLPEGDRLQVEAYRRNDER